MFETDRDVDLAIQSGTALPEQLASTKCVHCDAGIGYTGQAFSAFLLVIDENDQDWILCSECAGPVFNYVDTFFPPVVRSHFADPEDLEDLEYF